MTPLRIFVGYDAREAVAFHVLAHSLMARASWPIAITPIVRKHVAEIHRRPRGPLDSTDFSITRFLVPYLCEYRGIAVYMDCDMLARADIFELIQIVEDTQHLDYAVSVCKHDYVPKASPKFLGQEQTRYPRKNWSSLIVFDNSRCRALTPAYVETAHGLDLHRFEWLSSDRIGSLPLEWNWLVGEYEDNPAAKVLHYTLGGPWFTETRDCPRAYDWLVEATDALAWAGLR